MPQQPVRRVPKPWPLRIWPILSQGQVLSLRCIARFIRDNPEKYQNVKTEVGQTEKS